MLIILKKNIILKFMYKNKIMFTKAKDTVFELVGLGDFDKVVIYDPFDLSTICVINKNKLNYIIIENIKTINYNKIYCLGIEPSDDYSYIENIICNNNFYFKNNKIKNFIVFKNYCYKYFDQYFFIKKN